jgi:hypothetical protein
MQIAALLVTAVLFGGMVLFSAGFAAVLFAALPPALAGKVLRQTFPHFYLFVLATSLLGAALTLSHDTVSAALLGAVFASAVPARQTLMPAINAATDDGARRRFQVLHAASVAITLAHIVASGVVLARFLDA